MGPFTRCPACDCPMMVAHMTLDEETLLPGMWLLHVRCADCGAHYSSANPSDPIIAEAPMNVEEEEEGEEEWGI